ncbi:MAG: AI-2E family transporter [Gammaproteobacteria bacterium]|nr:MAG: AI-2E family transporter [Gammaproteobacteria bacterium]RLA60499.1 MAG: AI-2E family transporter [Gammaproteobacteria bacterium]
MNRFFEERSNQLILLGFLAVSLYASYWLIKPFLQPIILAMLVGMLASPSHDWLVTKLNGRKNSAALISTLVLALVFLIPALLVLVAILKQGVSYSAVVREWATGDNIHQLLNRPFMLNVKEWLGRVLPPNVLDPETIRSQALTSARVVGKNFAGVSTAMLGSLTAFMIDFMLLLFALFFVLRDHDKLIAFIRHALPLSRSQEDMLLQEVKDVSKSALLGSLLTAVTQGIVGGFGLWLAGFPALFWGAIMAVASLIPVVGTALIWVPAAIYLFVTGETGWAIFMMIWGVVAVGSIDNFLRPLFMQGALMTTVVVFFSLLGGLHVFGLIGVIYGPIIFSITLVFFKMYESEFANFLDSQDRR